MKIVDVKGLVLNETNYSDSSKILNVLTSEYGLIGIISKGCRNLKSKLRGASRKLVYGTFHFYYKENGLSTLISIDVISDYPKTIMNLENVVYASYLLDLTRQVVKQSKDSNILSLIVSALEKIESGLNPSVVTNILELKYLDFLGVSPVVTGCAVCGKTTNIVSLSPTAGGFICKDCYQNEGYYSDKAIKLLQMYYYVDLEKITKIDVNPKVNEEINKFLEDYYDRYTGIYLNSKKMLKNVIKLK
ncbi:MAG TPA: DNA repair protein RecO [Candidatus Onthousia excrementipullorum]|uniref:DNA repair protein RecO n=1 Tax=Candidatus Onthousia excrementipullorum TaxID=2840884 RepID=A0A9D1J485_9FIRM|nr:DNA repair protein RecO [Candidatus Onthousia excrementipullorum]